jgi:hypothetical protein
MKLPFLCIITTAAHCAATLIIVVLVKPDQVNKVEPLGKGGVRTCVMLPGQ